MTAEKNIENKVRGSMIETFLKGFQRIYTSSRKKPESKEYYNVIKVGTGTYLAYGSNGSVKDASRV